RVGREESEGDQQLRGGLDHPAALSPRLFDPVGVETRKPDDIPLDDTTSRPAAGETERWRGQPLPDPADRSPPGLSGLPHSPSSPRVAGCTPLAGRSSRSLTPQA